MVEMYVKLVMAGRRTCNPKNKEVLPVPSTYHKAVLERLTALGCDADGHTV